MSRDLVEVVIREHVNKTGITTPFTNGIPGRNWWERFLKRCPELAERKPQHLLSKRRSSAANINTQGKNMYR